MSSLQEQYDDAMFAFSSADYDTAITTLKQVLQQQPDHFDAQLALGMAYYRKGDYATAINEGHKAERLKPNEQLVHTNLSLFYMKAGDKATAERHGLQARISSWKADKSKPGEKPASDQDPELQMAKPPPQPVQAPQKFPEMPWKKKPARVEPLTEFIHLTQMKTAYELAMERLSKTSPTVQLTDKQKKEIAELESKCAAKIAERELFVKGEIVKAIEKGDQEAFEQLEKQLVSDRKSLTADLEEKKAKVRERK